MNDITEELEDLIELFHHVGDVSHAKAVAKVLSKYRGLTLRDAYFCGTGTWLPETSVFREDDTAPDTEPDSAPPVDLSWPGAGA